MIVTEHSRIAPCTLVEELPLMLEGKLYVAKQLTGTIQEIEESAIHSVPTLEPNNDVRSQLFLDIPAKIFHNILISNFSENFASVYLEAAIEAFQQQNLIEELTSWAPPPNTTIVTYTVPRFSFTGLKDFVCVCLILGQLGYPLSAFTSRSDCVSLFTPGFWRSRDGSHLVRGTTRIIVRDLLARLVEAMHP